MIVFFASVSSCSNCQAPPIGARVLSFIRMPFRIIAISLAICSSAIAQTDANTHEQNLRGAVISGLLRFTQWDDSTKFVPRNICLAGNPISAKPITLNAKSPSINKVIKLADGEPAKDFITKPCHVLVLGAKLDAQSLKFITDNATQKNWLTICDGCDDSNSRPMVILRKSGRRIVFDINLAEAKKSHIHFSSSLLELASKVRR